MAISAGRFEFLCELECPYEGEIKGVGKVVCQPVITPSTTPVDGAISDGVFFSTNYVSVVGPSIQSNNEDITELIMEKIIHKSPNGDIDLWDIHKRRYINFDKSVNIEVRVSGEQVFIQASDRLGNSYKLNGQHLELFLQDLENRMPPSISIPGLINDGVSSVFSLQKYQFEQASTRQKSQNVHELKKMLKKAGVKIKTKNAAIYREIMPKMYKLGGRVMIATSVISIGYDIGSTNKLKISNVVDAGMIAVCFISGGWAVAMSYYMLDLYCIYFTYRMYGHGKSIGDFINEWGENWGNLENGTLYNFK